MQLQPAEFKLLEAIHDLDLEALKKAKHTKIKLGTVEAECCRQIIYATVQKGMVTPIEFEDSGSHATAAPAELTAAIETALEQSGAEDIAAKSLPVGLGDLMAPGGIIKEYWTCFRACIFGFCIFCCYGRLPGGKPFTTCKVL